MTRRLVKGGYHVITAYDGEQAVEMAERFLPKLALVDVMMPKLSGIEVITRLARESPHEGDIGDPDQRRIPGR